MGCCTAELSLTRSSTSLISERCTAFGVPKIPERLRSARKHLESVTDISSDRKSGIITIKVYDNESRSRCGDREGICRGLNRIVISLNTSSAHKERVFLEERLGQVQQDLEQAEKDFSQFASKNTAIDVKEQGRAMMERSGRRGRATDCGTDGTGGTASDLHCQTMCACDRSRLASTNIDGNFRSWAEKLLRALIVDLRRTGKPPTRIRICIPQFDSCRFWVSLGPISTVARGAGSRL